MMRWIGVVLLLIGCQHGAEISEMQWGLQPLYQGFIPGQIAVLSCQIWPQQATYQFQPIGNATPPDQERLCKRIDQMVLDGFLQQPYMSGFTSKSVAKQMETSFPDYVDKMQVMWRGPPCPSCETPLAFYKKVSLLEPNWLIWLQTVSQHTRYSDAVLLPFLLFAQEQQFQDRGVGTSRRAVGILLMLVNTHDGSLIWGGKQTAMMEARSSSQQPSPSTPYLPYPDWEKLYSSLFTEALWKGFPGRLYRP
jgi:hypothetical protein